MSKHAIASLPDRTIPRLLSNSLAVGALLLFASAAWQLGNESGGGALAIVFAASSISLLFFSSVLHILLSVERLIAQSIPDKE